MSSQELAQSSVERESSESARLLAFHEAVTPLFEQAEPPVSGDFYEMVSVGFGFGAGFTGMQLEVWRRHQADPDEPYEYLIPAYDGNKVDPSFIAWIQISALDASGASELIVTEAAHKRPAIKTAHDLMQAVTRTLAFRDAYTWD